MLENIGGGKKVSPDEFKIVSHSPLTMPPNAELRPPRPGEPRPQEVTPADQAKEALSPALAGRTQQRVTGSGGGPPPPATGSEQALVQKAGQSAGSGIDPNIRSRVNQDTKTLNDNDKSFVDSLIFWQELAAPGHHHRPDQGAAAAARRPGGRPAGQRQPADHNATQARTARRRLLIPGSMLRRRGLLGGLAAGAALGPQAPAWAKLFSVDRRRAETFTLANGLQAVVLPSSRAPIVTQFVVYKAGSADEVFGKTGVAHFLEHMMFKGTATVGPTEFSRIVSKNGGRDNAYTTYDSTGYYQTVSPDRLELVMRMEADRMAGLRITEKELIPERQVVLEERRMRTDNSPSALLDEAVAEQLFGRHKPYGMPVIGYVDDVKRLSVGDLTAFYLKFYAPNNAFLIIAGDTTVEQVRKLAEKHYGPIATRKVEPRRRPGEGAPDLPQRVIRADARVAEPRWSRHYLAPSYAKGQTQHAYALQVLAHYPGRRRDQPPVARPGGRSHARAVDLGELQPDQNSASPRSISACIRRRPARWWKSRPPSAASLAG